MKTGEKRHPNLHTNGFITDIMGSFERRLRRKAKPGDFGSVAALTRKFALDVESVLDGQEIPGLLDVAAN